MDVEPVSTLVVSGRVDLTADVVLLDLADPGGAELPAWAPGAHVDLMLPGDMVRQYSLCGDPADRSRWQVGVLREAEGRGGSIFVHDKLPVGTEVDVRGPRNNFPLEEADGYVFVAGGIGVTPLIPMIGAADARGARWELVYGGRSRASMALVDDLVARYGDRVTVRPQDEFGLLDIPGLLGTARPGTAVYCCGPEPLLLAVESACAAWPEGALHIERFSPKEQAEPVLSGSFEVELALSEQVLTVSPDRSIVEVLEEAGIPVNVSCLEGTCGSCESAVLGGTPDHRDSVLTSAEQEANDIMMVCVSRSVTPRLVLDL
ncbi:2Fe-2S iron-sulfur cluster-binding protein [Streptomyces sp. NPDC008150]|uniref:PDR/VanB family oxidoreductase n=1 Tax=Streptomyces sp. NPDC008150 TaxID=3364816 RepID=UPI0036E600CA